MADQYYTLTLSIFRFAEAYAIEIAHADPTSHAQVAPQRGAAAFDTTKLLEMHGRADDYGKELARQLFADASIKQRFVQVETAAQATSSFLRLSISIDPSAQELSSLRWELLRHPDTGAALTTSEKLLFSRFMVSRDFRPVNLRARGELTALVAVSAPPGLEKRGLAPVDYEGEVGRARAALAGVKVRTLGGPGGPLTLDRLIEELRAGVDVLYLVCHGMFSAKTGASALVLQKEDGEVAFVKGEDLTGRLGDLQKLPRLVVLASCQSAGEGAQLDASQRATVQATVAGRLADAGVPAVVAMQGFITMVTVEKMMPVLFGELLRDGQIDRALAAARGKVRDRDDAWMPALYMRLTSGRIWYTPGFAGDKGKEVWRRLVAPVRQGKVVPILGPRLLEPVHGSAYDTARRLAEATRFPLSRHEWDDLPRVTAYMTVTESRFNAVDAYKKQLVKDLVEQHRSWLPPAEIEAGPKLAPLLKKVGEHLREKEGDAYRFLAELPASVYVTTNFDPLLRWTLEAKEKKPQQVATRWRYQKAPVSADAAPVAEPTAKTPLVYHVFGAFGPTEEGLVLSEDDYFDYLIQTSAAKLMPAQVESALVDNSLLFLGFRLTDWHFRVLFRLMMSLPGKERLKQYCHVAVQVDPDMQTMADVDRAKEYLAQYFGREANIDIYWGSAEDFLSALRAELASAGELKAEEPAKGCDDDF